MILWFLWPIVLWIVIWVGRSIASAQTRIALRRVNLTLFFTQVFLAINLVWLNTVATQLEAIGAAVKTPEQFKAFALILIQPLTVSAAHMQDYSQFFSSMAAVVIALQLGVFLVSIMAMVRGFSPQGRNTAKMRWGYWGLILLCGQMLANTGLLSAVYLLDPGLTWGLGVATLVIVLALIYCAWRCLKSEENRLYWAAWLSGAMAWLWVIGGISLVAWIWLFSAGHLLIPI